MSAEKENEKDSRAKAKGPKKPYRSPKLTVHGTLREITRKHSGTPDQVLDPPVGFGSGA